MTSYCTEATQGVYALGVLFMLVALVMLTLIVKRYHSARELHNVALASYDKAQSTLKDALNMREESVAALTRAQGILATAQQELDNIMGDSRGN